MKLTWFGGRTLRIHIGGRIIVWHPAPRPDIDAEELTSGADVIVAAEEKLARMDPGAWQPRRTPTALEAAGQGGVEILEIAPDVILVGAPGESPLLLVGGEVPPLGRWGRDAIVVAFAGDAAGHALAGVGPRLIALALEGGDLDRTFADLRDRLGGTALTALEPGLALEV